ncbi:unnamed protein product, partial [Staurois parvus]
MSCQSTPGSEFSVWQLGDSLCPLEQFVTLWSTWSCMKLSGRLIFPLRWASAATM